LLKPSFNGVCQLIEKLRPDKVEQVHFVGKEKLKFLCASFVEAASAEVGEIARHKTHRRSSK